MRGNVTHVFEDLENGGFVVILHVEEFTAEMMRLRDVQDLRLSLTRFAENLAGSAKAFAEKYGVQAVDCSAQIGGSNGNKH